MNISEKLTVIADNTPEVGEQVNSAKETLSGEVVTVTDICDIEHTVAVRLSSLNLFDVSQIPNNEPYLINNGDGSITVSGGYGHNTGKKLSEVCPDLKAGETVRLRMNTTGNNVMYLSGSNYTWGTGVHEITEADLNSWVCLYGKPDGGTYTISQIWINRGTEAQAYTPYIADFSSYKVSTVSAKVKASGKNLFDKEAWVNYCNEVGNNEAILNNTYLGETCFSFELEKKASGQPVFTDISFKANTQYTFSASAAFSYSNETIRRIAFINITYTDGTAEYFGADVYSDRFTEFTLTSKANKSIQDITYPWWGHGLYAYCKWLQIEYGTTASPYEPYKGQTYTPNSDGTVEGVKSIYPTTVISTDIPGALITCTYFADGSVYGKFIELGKAFESAKALI